jgi:hypothetical protein
MPLLSPGSRICYRSAAGATGVIYAVRGDVFAPMVREYRRPLNMIGNRVYQRHIPTAKKSSR